MQENVKNYTVRHYKTIKFNNEILLNIQNAKNFRRATRTKFNIVILRAERAEKMQFFLLLPPPLPFRNMDRRPCLLWWHIAMMLTLVNGQRELNQIFNCLVHKNSNFLILQVHFYTPRGTLIMYIGSFSSRFFFSFTRKC